MEKANGEFCDFNLGVLHLASCTLTINTILELCSRMGQYRRLACRGNCTGLLRMSESNFATRLTRTLLT